VYSVSFLGKLRVPPVPVAADDDPDVADDPDAGVVDDELLHALATPSVSTATAAVPYRHFLPVLLVVGLTSPASSSKSPAMTPDRLALECKCGSRVLLTRNRQLPKVVELGFLSVLGATSPL